MVDIGLTQAKLLAQLMSDSGAYRATTEVHEVRGKPVTFVILWHEDQREGSWQSLHVLSTDLGTLDKKWEAK